jgi:hypothetical protein
MKNLVNRSLTRIKLHCGPTILCPGMPEYARDMPEYAWDMPGICPGLGNN